MGRSSRPPPGELVAASLFAGRHCDRCPAHAVCCASETTDACGDPLEYGAHANALHPTDVPLTKPDELQFRHATWLPIPVLPSGLVIGDRLVPNQTSAVRLARSTQRSVWNRQPARRDVDRIAVLIGDDAAIDALWRRQGSLGALLRACDVDLVVAPGFSTWWGDPPFAAIHAMARSAEFARLLSRQVPTIPTVVWRYPGDLDRWADWLVATEAPAFCMDLALRSVVTQLWATRGVAHLASRLASSQARPRLLAHGPSTRDRIRAIAEAWPGDITFLSQDPYRKAIAGRRLEPDMSYVPATDQRREDLVEHNARIFNVAAGEIVAATRPALVRGA